jgi:hypothetical protein
MFRNQIKFANMNSLNNNNFTYDQYYANHTVDTVVCYKEAIDDSYQIMITRNDKHVYSAKIVILTIQNPLESQLLSIMLKLLNNRAHVGLIGDFKLFVTVTTHLTATNLIESVDYVGTKLKHHCSDLGIRFVANKMLITSFDQAVPTNCYQA